MRYNKKKPIRNNKIKKPQNESMRKHKLTRKATVIFRFCHFKCADRNYIVRQYTYVFVCRKVANKGKKHIFFIKVGNILQNSRLFQ